MAYPVYSTRFLKVVTGGTMYAYVVPAGYRAVVKNLSASNGGAVPAYVYASVAGAVAWINASLAAYSSQSLATMQVAYAGEEIQAYSSEPAAHILVSGFLLREQALADDDALVTAGEELRGSAPWPPELP